MNGQDIEGMNMKKLHKLGKWESNERFEEIE